MGKTICLVLGFLFLVSSSFGGEKRNGYSSGYGNRNGNGNGRARPPFPAMAEARPVNSNPASTHLVHRYLVEKLKIEKPELFDMSYNFFELTRSLGDDRMRNAEALKEMAETFFAPESAESLRQILEAAMKTDYNNALILAEAGVGKSFLVDQIAGLFSFGILPDYLAKEIAYPADQKSPYANILRQFINNTQVVKINTALLMKHDDKPGEAWSSEEVRMRATLEALFAEARKEFNLADKSGKRVGRRTFFMFDEFATLPPFVKELLKTILDETGFQNPDVALVKKPDPGFSVLCFTTPAEYRRISAGDSAIDRRFKLIKIAEPNENLAFRIVRAKSTNEWEPLYGVAISDEAIWHLIHSRRFLTTPPLAMPGSILAAVNTLMTWKLTNPGESSNEITVKDAQLYLTRAAGLTDLWLEGPNGEPPLSGLEERALQHVVVKDPSLHKIAERWKAFSRLEHNGAIPVFIVMGPTGSGKDTRFEALNMALFGHRGKQFNFSLAGTKGFGIDALISGPPLGNHSDGEQGLLVRALDSGLGNSAVAFNEVADTPSEELEKLKVLVESGEVRPSGMDSRPRPLRYPIFLMGQWGEEIFDGMTDAEKMERYQSLTQDEIEGFLLKGKGDGTIGAVPPALIERAKKSGGIYFVPPMVVADFPAVIGTWLPGLIEDLNKNNAIEVVVSPQLIKFIANTAASMAHGTRGLSAVTSDFTKGAISRSMDKGLPTTHLSLILDHIRRIDGQDFIVVQHVESGLSYQFTPQELYRHKFSCGGQLGEMGQPAALAAK